MFTHSLSVPFLSVYFSKVSGEIEEEKNSYSTPAGNSEDKSQALST